MTVSLKGEGDEHKVGGGSAELKNFAVEPGRPGGEKEDPKGRAARRVTTAIPYLYTADGEGIEGTEEGLGGLSNHELSYVLEVLSDSGPLGCLPASELKPIKPAEGAFGSPYSSTRRYQ